MTLLRKALGPWIEKIESNLPISAKFPNFSCPVGKQIGKTHPKYVEFKN